MIRRIAMLATAAAAALSMTMTPAHADGGADTAGKNAGTVWFQSYGEHFTVNDWTADGHGVLGVIEVFTRNPETGYREWMELDTVFNGNGLHGAAEHRNYDLNENQPVRYMVCLVDSKNDSTPERCSDWEGDLA